MAATNCYFIWYDNGIKNMSFDEIIADDLKVALTTSAYTPDSDLHEFFDVSVTNELATANGYIAGGQSLTTKTFIESATAGQFIFDADNPTWNITTAPLTAHIMVLYNDTPASNKPIYGYGYLDYNGGTPADVVVPVSNSLTIAVPTLGFFHTTKVNGI